MRKFEALAFQEKMMQKLHNKLIWTNAAWLRDLIVNALVNALARNNRSLDRSSKGQNIATFFTILSLCYTVNYCALDTTVW